MTNTKIAPRIVDGEIWKPILGRDGYDVSNAGRVRSWWGKNGVKNRSPRIKHLSEDRDGYLVVSLYRPQHRRFRVHRLVASMFIGQSSEIVHHKDGNRKNNCVDNLEYTTNRVNVTRGIGGRGSSSFIGVSWCSRRKKWGSSIRINNRTVMLGYYDTEVDAAEAYRKKLEEVGENNILRIDRRHGV